MFVEWEGRIEQASDRLFEGREVGRLPGRGQIRETKRRNLRFQTGVSPVRRGLLDRVPTGEDEGVARELTRSVEPRRVVVLAFDGVRFLDVVGPLEVMTVANEHGDHYVAQVASPGGRDVVTTTGNRLGADVAVAEVERDVDTLLVAGSPDWELLLEPGIVSATQRLARSARRIVSVCTGSFALAAAGLLDGKRAATHWRHAAALRKRFPEVNVDPEALFVRDGNVFTSAGIASGMDLALALVEDDLGPDVARSTAKVLVVFLQRPGGQSQFSTWTATGAVKNEPLRIILDEIALDPAGKHTLEAIAERANFSVRHISRLFEEQLQMTPGAYVERVRLETARVMLEAGDDELVTVARKSGYGSAETLRRAFIREFGVPPGAYRSRFRTTGIGHPRDGSWPRAPHRVRVAPTA
jgi:transcriptional regulator GlxA family with amidase domain